MAAPRRAQSVPIVLLLLLTLTPGSLASQLVSDGPARSQSRRGMWFNVGLGVGIGDDIGGQSGNLAVGWTLSPRLLMGVGSAGPIGRVLLHGQGRLFLPGRETSYLYTP